MLLYRLKVQHFTEIEKPVQIMKNPSSIFIITKPETLSKTASYSLSMLQESDWPNDFPIKKQKTANKNEQKVRFATVCELFSALFMNNAFA